MSDFEVHDFECELPFHRAGEVMFCGCNDRADLREAERAEYMVYNINDFLRLDKREFPNE
jgi:hypothetical protein